MATVWRGDCPAQVQGDGRARGMRPLVPHECRSMPKQWCQTSHQRRNVARANILEESSLHHLCPVRIIKPMSGGGLIKTWVGCVISKRGRRGQASWSWLRGRRGAPCFTKDNTGLVQERKEGKWEKILSAALLRRLTKPILIGLAIVMGPHPACLRCIWLLLQDLPKKRHKKETLIKVGTIPNSWAGPRSHLLIDFFLCLFVPPHCLLKV